MGIKSDYKNVKKLTTCNSGIGCCNKYFCHPRTMKPKSRRLARRVNRQELNKELGKLSRED